MVEASMTTAHLLLPSALEGVRHPMPLVLMSRPNWVKGASKRKKVRPPPFQESGNLPLFVEVSIDFW